MHNKLEQWINWICYDEVIAETNNAPHKLLGLHRYSGGQIFSAYRPGAVEVGAVDCDTGNIYEMEKVDDKGFFAFYLENGSVKDYKFRIRYAEDDVITIDDPYRFDCMLMEVDRYLFGEGRNFRIYDSLGAHLVTIDGIEGALFAVWAPNARSVSVVGDFNMWDPRLHLMKLLDTSGIYELFIPGVRQGDLYKYRILTRNGDSLFKADPYAYYSELRPGNASRVCDINGYSWNDAEWMKKRATIDRTARRRMPMSIYECHLGSWKRADASENGFLSYRQLADELGQYLTEMKYTHIELMGIAEYPYDGSWGYQVTGYYAPTSRYGEPQDFMYFVDHMHSLGIQVILDWVPAHFPKDAHGLGRFDGTPLYESGDPRRGEHPDWGTYIFDYSRNEVCNFVIANAIFWANVYHVDGLRVDAVASMLYLDYGKKDDEWLPNEDGSHENRDVVKMLRHLNKAIGEHAPGVYMIAEESTSWAGVTAPVGLDGLGFMFKWNMGWMNDFLEYMKTDPLFRSGCHNKLCFSMMYAYSENFIQVLSHDEVVHGKASMIYKMPGNNDEKMGNLKTAYAFMYGHPGKKLLFMGQEFAQTREWSEARELDWNLLAYPEHNEIQAFVKALNTLYNEYDALYYNDYDTVGFEWMSCDDRDNSIVAFVRRGSTINKHLLFICNFTPVAHAGYRIGVPCGGRYSEVLNSDDFMFGGMGHNAGTIDAEEISCNGRDYSIQVNVPSLAAVILEYDYKEEIS